MNDPFEPLDRAPIRVSEAVSDDDLAREAGERLDALLTYHGLPACAAGWRELALRLALQHEPCLRFTTPVDRDPDAPSGAEPGKLYWIAKDMLKLERQLGSAKAAAEAMAKVHKDFTVRRLQNIAADMKAGRIKKPRYWGRPLWDAKMRRALWAAAHALETRSRF